MESFILSGSNDALSTLAAQHSFALQILLPGGFAGYILSEDALLRRR
jgi:hypothetical protein